MGKVERGIIKKPNGDYWLDYYANGYRKRLKIGKSLTLARSILNKKRLQLVENRHLDIQEESTITFKELADLYMEIYSKPNKRSWVDDNIILKRAVEYFGNVRASDISSQMMERYKADRVGKVSGARINRELVCMKTMYNRGISWGKVKENPVKGIKLFKEAMGRTRYLEKHEWEALQRECSPSLLPRMQFAFHTGLRLGEMQYLKWADVDLILKQIRLTTSKSGYGRYVPINESIERVLAGLERVKGNPYVFAGRKGGPFCRSGWFRKDFSNALKRAGIEGFRWHDLRHSFASHLAMRGMSLQVIGEILGHRTPNMTRRYAHLSPQHKLDAVRKLDADFGNHSCEPKKGTAESGQTCSEEAA